MVSNLKKNFLVTIFLFFLFINSVNGISNDKVQVSLNKCVDGDTAYFIINKIKTKVRFLAIDTPESTNKIEPYGKEASEFTCNLLTEANKIEIEYDKNKTDKYNRTLAWIFVDDKLLQQLIIEEGLAEVAYLYDNYKYTDVLKASEAIAKSNKLNIWSENKSETNDILLLLLIATIIVLLYSFSSKFRKKLNKKLKFKLKKEFDSIIK